MTNIMKLNAEISSQSEHWENKFNEGVEYRQIDKVEAKAGVDRLC
jgi:hypothetical protein